MNAIITNFIPCWLERFSITRTGVIVGLSGSII